ncbi:hydroxyproline-rich glycoprotein family protein, partial [Trifolium medium]|nr:hydroxyproline-rich glycoprotein family protein [Trifolium medium]MCI06126.1 hydroxyproline-rich glycoprotein family protein [Trifolium medium]
GFLPNHQWVSDVNLSPCPSNNRRNEISVNHRVSFELSAGKVPSSVENKPTTSSAWTRLISSKFKNSAAAAATDKEENVCDDKQVVTETLIDAPKQTKAALVIDDATVDEKDHQSLTLSSSTKEFNFNNAEGGDSPAPNIVADWWANEKVAGNESGASKDWSFFPIIQPGLS